MLTDPEKNGACLKIREQGVLVEKVMHGDDFVGFVLTMPEEYYFLYVKKTARRGGDWIVEVYDVSSSYPDPVKVGGVALAGVEAFNKLLPENRRAERIVFNVTPEKFTFQTPEELTQFVSKNFMPSLVADLYDQISA